MICELCRTNPANAGSRVCARCLSIEIQTHRRAYCLPHKSLRYPFSEMDVGEQRVIDQPRKRVAPAATQYGKRHGRMFSTIKIDDNRCRLTRIA